MAHLESGLVEIHWTDRVIILQRVDAAKPRIENLNPLVTIQGLSHDVLQKPEVLDALVGSVDLVCVTDWDREGLVRHVMFPWARLPSPC